MELHAFLLSILVLTLLSGSDARSVEQICSEKCVDGLRPFFVKDNYEYSYTYRTNIESSFHDGSTLDQTTRFDVEIPFTITTGSDCNLVLQVKRGMYFDNRNPETEDEIAWQEAVSEYPMQFSWQNGIVEQICPSANEPSWVVNFKRGILSAMQTSTRESASAVRETDVSGDCEADYFVENSRVTTIRKTKDYSKCTNRDKHLLFSWSLPYELSSPRQNYIHSQQSCRLVVADVLESVECDEEHVFRPFSTDEAGAKTKITQHISFVRQRRASSSDNSRTPIRRTNLEYEEGQDSEMNTMEQRLQATKTLLSDICENMEGEGYENVARQFVSLVYAVRKLDADSLTELNNHIDTCTEWRSSLSQMLANTMPFCGTESCVTFASSLIINDALKDDVAERWLTGFSLIKKPTRAMITSVLDIVESRKFPSQSFLALGSMISRFCQNIEGNCMNNVDIRNAMEVLNQHLGTNCRNPNPETRKLTLLALRSIGNAGQATSLTVLGRCITETRNPMEIRIAAVDAFRRISCRLDRSVLMDTLFNTDEDSELRIAAYMNLMQCPTEQVVRNIKNLLENEKNMQVGSYIWSHVSQLKESADPLKHFYQALLEGVDFKEVDLDPRKYSRYYEASVFSERLNLGGTGEAKLVWSPKSFIPRSASANITIDLFGQAINLLEFGGRLEGVENYLQSLLEPKAYEKRKSNKDALSFGSDRKKTMASQAVADGARASWFMRVFGNELVYGNTEMNEPIETTSSSFLSDFISKFMSDEGYNYHDNALLLNSVHTLPTGTGFPLVVAFNGSTSIDVNAKGKLKFGFGAEPKYFVSGKVTPRTAVVVSGSMVIDAHVKKTGIATESTAYTSTSLGGFVKLLNGGQSFEVEIDSPYSKNMAFSFKHKLLKVVGNTAEEIGGDNSDNSLNEDVICTETYLGQRICLKKSYYADRYSTAEANSLVFPVDGRLELSAYVEKVDDNLLKYTLSGSGNTVYENEEDMIPSNLLLRLAFDTPGSSVNRKTTVFASYSIPDKQIAIRAQRASDTLQVQGYYVSQDGTNELRLSAELNERIYSLQMDMRKTFTAERRELTSNVVIELPSKTMTVTAILNHNVGNRLQASLAMQNFLPSPIELNFDLQDKSQDQDRLSFSGSGKIAVSPFINSEFVMDMNLKPRRNNMIFNINYKIGGMPKHSILFHHRRTNLGSPGVTDWNVYHKLTSSQFPAVNHHVAIMHSYSDSSTKSSVDIEYGSEMDQPSNPYKLEMRQEYQDESDDSATKLNGGWSFNLPYMEVNREMRFEYLHDQDSLTAKIDSIVSNDPCHFTFLWKNNKPGQQMLHQTLDIALYPTVQGDWRLSNEIEEVSEKIYQSTSTLTLGKTNDLRFVQEMTFIDRPNNKSVLMSLKKGKENSEILTASSVNYMTSASKYMSKNQVHLSGYAQRGLDLTYEKTSPMECKVTVDFLKSFRVLVGMDASYKKTDAGKHLTIGVRQLDVQQRTITLKTGYELVKSRSFETYTSLVEDDAALLSFETSATRENHVLSGNFRMFVDDIPSLPLTKIFATNTSVSFTTGDNGRFEINHQRMEKKLHFTVETENDLVRGILEHNHCNYFNSGSYEIARLSDGVKITVASGQHQAHATVTSDGNQVTMSWDHQNMPELIQLKVPTEAVLRLERNDDHSNLHALLTLEGDTAFELEYSSIEPTTQLAMTNNLFAIFPETANGTLSTSSEVVRFDGTINAESVNFAFTNNLPESASIVVTHNIGIVETALVPNRMEIAYDYTEPEKVLNITIDNKSMTLSGKYVDSSSMEASMSSSGFKVLPKKLTVSLSSQIEENSLQITVNGMLDEDQYSAKVEGSKAFESSSTSFPYIDFIGKAGGTFVVDKNDETLMSVSRVVNIQKRQISHTVEVHQSIWEDNPTDYSETEKISLRGEEITLLWRRTLNDEVTQVTATYSPGNVQLSQSVISELPEQLTLTYDFAIEHGEATIQTTEPVKTATFSYRMSGSNDFQIVASHSVDEIETVVPKMMKIGYQYLSDRELQASYTWGQENGAIQATRSDKDLNVVVSSTKLNFTFSCDTEDTNVNVRTELTYGEQDYSFSLDAGYKMDDYEINVKSCHADVEARFNDKYVNSRNSIGIEDASAHVNVVLHQNINQQMPAEYNLDRTISWNAESSQIRLEVDGTEQDPFYLNVVLAHDGLNSATAEIHHKQAEWDMIPRDSVTRIEKTMRDGSFEVALTITTETTKTAKLTTKYGLDNTSVYLTADFENDLLCDRFDTKQARMHVRGQLTESELSWSMVMSLNDKAWNETFEITFSNSFAKVVLDYGLEQNLVNRFPRKIALTMIKTPQELKSELTFGYQKFTSVISFSDSDFSISITQSEDEKVTSYDFTIKYSIDQPMVQLEHNLEFLPVPTRLVFEAEIDQWNVRVSVDIDQKSYELLVRREETDGGMKLTFVHNIEEIPVVPQSAVITFTKNPLQITMKWEGATVSFSATDDAIHFEQNVVDILPTSLGVKVSLDTSTNLKNLGFQIDIEGFSLKFESICDCSNAFSLTLYCGSTLGEDTLFRLNSTTNMQLTEGHAMIDFTQSVTEDLVDAFRYVVDYSLGEDSGSVTFESGTEQPIIVTMSYDDFQRDQFNFALTHNIDDVADMIPLESNGRVTLEWTEARKSFTARMSNDGVQKVVTIALSTDINSEEKVVTFTMNHDFDILETSLLVPKTAKFDLHLSDNSYVTSLSYTLDSEQKYVKFVARTSDSDVVVTVDQNIVTSYVNIPNSRRRQEVQVPQKMTLRLVESDGYQAFLSFKTGQKRRYLNVKYSNNDNIWKLSINQNLNRILQTRYPTESLLSISTNSSAAQLRLEMDDNELTTSIWMKTNEGLRMGLAFEQNFDILTTYGVPTDAGMSVEKTSEDLTVSARYGVCSGTVTVSSPFELKIDTKCDTFSVSTTTLVVVGDGTISVGLSGTQTGLDNLPPTFNINEELTYNTEDMSADYTLTHNIDLLKRAGVPKRLNATVRLPRIQENAINGALSIQADDFISDNSLEVSVRKIANGIEMGVSGVRTRNFWSDSMSDKLSYNGKITATMTSEPSKEISVTYTFSEANMSGNVLTNHDCELVLTCNGNVIYWNMSLVASPQLAESISCSGSLTYGNSFEFSNSYERGDYYVMLSITGQRGQSFQVTTVNKYGTATLSFDKASQNQLSFSHDMDLLDAIPRSILVSFHKETMTLTVTADTDSYNLHTSFGSTGITIAYSSNGEDIFSFVEEHQTHPLYRMKSSIKIAPLKLNFAGDLQAQFFRPEDGKSYIAISATDMTSMKGVTSSVEAFLQNSDIRDIYVGASMSHNFTEEPVEFAMEYSVKNTPLKYKFSLNVQNYMILVNGSAKAFSARVKIPNYYRWNNALVEVSCSGDDERRVSSVLMQLNDEVVSFKCTSGEDSTAYYRDCELKLPFFEGRITSGYRVETIKGGVSVTTTLSDGTKHFSGVTKYQTEEESGNTEHRISTDVEQDFIRSIPTVFTASNDLIYGPKLFSNDWRVSSAGEDVLRILTRLQYSNDGFESEIRWKHPFENTIMKEFDESLTVQLSDTTLDVRSVTRHSLQLQNLPQEFETVGKITINDGLYDNDWKISSEGDDIITLKETVTVSDAGVNSRIQWKHPFKECFVMTSYDGSLDIEIRHNGVTVNSDITQSSEAQYIPGHFVTTGNIAYGEGLYDSKWNIESEGEVLVTLNKKFTQTPDGYKLSLTWRQPYEKLFMTHFDTDVTLRLVSNGMDLKVDISHPFDHPYIPKRFITNGVVRVEDNLYDSDWTISSENLELVALRKLLRRTDDGFNGHFLWKQPYEEFPRSIDSSVGFTRDVSSSKFTSSLNYNDQHRWALDYGFVAPDPFSGNVTIAFTYNDQVYSNELYYAVKSWKSTGKKFVVMAESNLPEHSMISSVLPSKQRLGVTAYYKELTTIFRTSYTTNFMPNPVIIQGMTELQQGSTIINSTISVKISPESSSQMDAEFAFAVDSVSGITVLYKMPAIGLDQEINVKYQHDTKVLTLSFFQGDEEPIVITIDLSIVIPKMKQILETLRQKDILPKLKVTGDVVREDNVVDAYVGITIRSTTYTVHFITGQESQYSYLNITTKRNFQKLDTILAVTARLLNDQTVQVEMKTSKHLSRFLNYAFSSSAAEIKDRVVVIADAIIEVLNSFDGIIHGSDKVERIFNRNRGMAVETVEGAKNVLLKFITDANTELLTSVQDGEEGVNSGLWKAIVALSTAAEKLREIANRPFELIKKDFLTAVSEQVYNEIRPKLEPLIQAMNSINAGQLFLELVQDGITKFIFGLEKNAEALLKASREPLAQLVRVDDNTVVFNIPLHITVNDLVSPPSLHDIALWIGESSLAYEVKAQLEILYRAIDLYHQYRSVLNMPLDELLPPFKGHAEVSGFRHVRTFDGTRYDYRSSCQSTHVLAEDAVDNEFTVYMSYGPSPSVTVETSDLLGGRQTIILKSDYTVTDERGRDILVPTEYADVVVTRTSEIVTVQTTFGLVVSCNFRSELCTVDVSPFYFARLSGMLGTFNNEINDDFMGRGMVEVRTFEELAEAWMLPGSCDGDNEEQRCTTQTSNGCIGYFEERSSPFSSCFSVEDPAPYKRNCMKDTCSTGTLCNAFAAYARRCALRGVFLPTPSNCMSCSSVDGREVRSARQISVSAADVVFVIEKSGCIRFKKKDYKKMIGEIHSALNATIARGNVNYAVVGFGGPGQLAEPHTTTFGSDLFIHSASHDLENANEKAILNALKRGERSNAESDILQAISYASQLPFRAGASRTIVLMTCDDCSGESQVQSSYVRDLVQQQGVVIHHLRQKNIQAGKSAKKVYGFNTEEIFAKTVGDNLPRSELKTTGNDQCLSLVDLTGGSIWNSNIIGKDSIRFLANEISSSVNNVQVQDCVCGISTYGTTTSKCSNAAIRR